MDRLLVSDRQKRVIKSIVRATKARRKGYNRRGEEKGREEETQEEMDAQPGFFRGGQRPIRNYKVRSKSILITHGGTLCLGDIVKVIQKDRRLRVI